MHTTSLTPEPKRLSATDWVGLLLLPLSLILAVAICYSEKKPEAPTAVRTKLFYSDFLFDRAFASRKFEADNTKLKEFYNFEDGSAKTNLRKAQVALSEELRSKQGKGFPLTRLAVVNQFLGESPKDYKDLSSLATKEDFALAADVRAELSNEKSSGAIIDRKNLEKALTDNMMLQAFLVRAKHTSDADRRLAVETLKTKSEEIQKSTGILFLLDAITSVIGVGVLCVSLRKMRDKNAPAQASTEIVYPKPKSVGYTIFSVIFAVVCASIANSFVKAFLACFLPAHQVRGMVVLIFPALILWAIYEFSVRQQGLPFLEGFRFRWPIQSTGKGSMLSSAWGAFFVLSLCTTILGILSLIFPSSIPEVSNFPDVFDAIDNSKVLATILAITVTAPILEEALFRGYMYSAFRTKLGSIPAALLCAGLFSLAHFHFNPYNAFHHFLLGIFSVYLLEKTRSIVPGIILHSLWNTFVTIFILSSMAGVYPLERVLF